MNKGLVFAILLLPSFFHPGIREASLTVHASSADPAVQSLVDDLSTQQADILLGDRTTPNLTHSYNMFVGFYEITPLDIKVA